MEERKEVGKKRKREREREKREREREREREGKGREGVKLLKLREILKVNYFP